MQRKETGHGQLPFVKAPNLTITVSLNIFFNKLKGLKGIKMDKIKNDALDDLFSLEELGPEANLQLPDPSLVQKFRALKNRSLWITKDIDETLFQEMQQIIQWNKEDADKGIPIEDRKKIFIYVHSYGGDLYSAMGFLSVMKLSKTPIVTVNLACAMSCGAMILINGHKGHRYCLKNSTALLHSGSAMQRGDFNAVQQQNQQYKNLISRVHNNIIENTTISKATLTKKLKTDWYLDDTLQLQYSLVDHIVDDILQILN